MYLDQLCGPAYNIKCVGLMWFCSLECVIGTVKTNRQKLDTNLGRSTQLFYWLRQRYVGTSFTEYVLVLHKTWFVVFPLSVTLTNSWVILNHVLTCAIAQFIIEILSFKYSTITTRVKSGLGMKVLKSGFQDHYLNWNFFVWFTYSPVNINN